MNTQLPTILIIVGITGDLAQRKLLPAIEKIAAAKELPEHFKIVGISRRDVSARVTPNDKFAKRYLEMFQMNLDDLADYNRLKKHLSEIEKSFGEVTQKLFYLSVPPQISRPVIELLGLSGFGKMKNTKLLLEKPFGSDLVSAQELIKDITRHFTEEQIYRIDHYLAKEMAQNILVFRNGNSLFKHTWNKDFIESIEITASESIDIERRSIFYEQTGALRDLIQSHLLQVAALTLMEIPKEQSWQQISEYRLTALSSVSLPQGPVTKFVKRGQYRGYEQEVNNPNTTTETFVSLTLSSSDPRWQGVPIKLTTGKALEHKYTEVRIHYRQEHAREANQLVLRIQPREGIELSLWSKRPGYARELEPVELNFNYHERSQVLPQAYEQVLLDAMHSDHNLFTSSEEVLASWKILKPVQEAWSMSDKDLVKYDKKTPLEKVLTSMG